MNHLRLLPVISALFAFCIGSYSAFGQTYETDFGWRDSEETPWDGLWPISTRPVTLVNTNQTGQMSALLTLNRNFDGVALMSTSIHKEGYRLEGRSLGSTPFMPSGGYHLTGFWRKHFILNPSIAFLLKTDWVGRPQKCVKKVTKGFSEHGMVVEESGSDVLVAGNASPNLVLQLPFPPAPAPAPAPPAHFWAARFNVNMKKVWAFDYFSSDTARFYVHEGCMGIYIKGTEKRPGLALTGYYIKKGEQTRHTFVSMIDYQTGAEIWRTSCLVGGIANDEGLDIVQDPESLLLFVVGYAQRDISAPKRMFTSVVDAAGTHIGSSYHEVPPNAEISEMVARDVCLSFNQRHAVVTGYVVNPQGISKVKTFATELRIEPNTAANWTVFYDLSFSDLRGSEAINRVPQDQNFTQGYLITTGGRLEHVDAGNKDAQILKIRWQNGLLDDGCPVTRFQLEPKLLVPQKPQLRFYQLKSRWCKDRVKYSHGDPNSSTCK